MKLAFSGQAHYPDLDAGFELYEKRAKTRLCVDKKTYRRIIKMYCRKLAKRLETDGMIDLPSDLGSIMTAVIRRKPQYRGDKFVGFGKMDWESGHYDGTYKTFGLVFLPNRTKSQNLRCYGYVANRQLFKRVKELYKGAVLDFNDNMI